MREGCFESAGGEQRQTRPESYCHYAPLKRTCHRPWILSGQSRAHHSRTWWRLYPSPHQWSKSAPSLYEIPRPLAHWVKHRFRTGRSQKEWSAVYWHGDPGSSHFCLRCWRCKSCARLASPPTSMHPLDRESNSWGSFHCWYLFPKLLSMARTLPRATPRCGSHADRAVAGSLRDRRLPWPCALPDRAQWLCGRPPRCCLKSRCKQSGHPARRRSHAGLCPSAMLRRLDSFPDPPGAPGSHRYEKRPVHRQKQ